ncbi:MAG: alpha/beta hydrolase family protein [Armatimonadota bacterium]
MSLQIGKVDDKRFSVVRHLNMVYNVSYLASRYRDRVNWEKRAAEIREQVLGAAGLLPMPPKCPLNARIFGKIDHGDYTVEKAYFESYPGFYCTGNLYRPKGRGPFPGILNTHGHWGEGRFVDNESSSIPTRAANLAKQGYVVFSYDMVGFNDSKQVTIPQRHDALGERRNRLWGISLGGLQTWNSIRAIDFLQSLPDVDPNRIGVTGSSGGGTQTFLVTAADPRVSAAAPVCMVSAHMQGGCRCENLPNLRIDTNNVEITAVTAPRPLLLVAATGDWTKNTPYVECPAIKSIYKLFAGEERIGCVIFDVGHNYNKDSREAVYSFFARWLLGKTPAQPIREEVVKIDSREDLLCFSDGKLQDDALAPDAIVDQLIKYSEKQLFNSRPKDKASLQTFRKLYEPALRRALSVPSEFQGAAVPCGSLRHGDRAVHKLIIRDKLRGAEIPALLWEAESLQVSCKSKRIAILVHENGKQGFLSQSCHTACDLVVNLTKNGWFVLAIDVFNTGEHTAPNESPARDYDKDFFDTYNRTDTAERVYDILLTVRCVRGGNFPAGTPFTETALVGYGKAGLWCLLAAPFVDVNKAVIDAGGLNISDDSLLLDEFYVPCLRRAGDFRSAMALTAPAHLFIHNTQGRFDTTWADAGYTACGSAHHLRVSKEKTDDAVIAAWLTKN